MSSAFDIAAGQPWLMLPSALDSLLAVSQRMGDPAALEARLGHRLDNTRTVAIRNGVAIVPIIGPIFRYANLFTEISGATSTQVLATDIRQALDNPAVKAIVLNIDSPGGVASGINELADLIYAGRAKKRIVAYVGGSGASAAYWIASAAHEIVIDDTAMLGSIGVVLEVSVAQDAKGAPRRYEIVSRKAPNKRPDLGTEEGRSKVQVLVNSLADVFVAKVSRNLGVKHDRVVSMGNAGGILVGAAAVKAGLAKRLGSLESVVAELATGRTAPEGFSTKSPQPVKSLSGPGAPRSEANPIDEQARVDGIMELSSPGLESVVRSAIADGSTVEGAACQMLNAIKVAIETREASSSPGAGAPTSPTPRPANYSTASIWKARRNPR
ncbi:S49 family peptidase [Pseudomonas coleopterorum]|uniref:S49 family peptidase n=1 Tax=Pseudomonas coleopterorum TaxID=1605838 RepID=A0AAJ6LZ57_9PSED|nr:S49 family peptidase [Pseudomonas coleopterorum]WNC09305.1 S49 family peptidase [Pseudomonas coleopterorum]